MRIISTFFIICICCSTIFSQSKIFGPKGGLTIGFQNWDGFQRDPLLSFHGALYVEGFKEEAPASFFGQIGLHTRGSSERAFFVSGPSAQAFRQKFRFDNAAAIFGVKKRLNLTSDSKPYFAFGMRVEYTIGTNLDESSEFAGYFPIEGFVNKWNYGASASFGYEFPFSEFVGGLIEASIHPDLSFQYQQPGGIGVISPITGQSVVLREQQIRNVTFELSIGFRFLHKVIYVD